MTNATDTLRPFVIDVPDHKLEDLRRRLLATRWPDHAESSWKYGSNAVHTRSLVDHWANTFDWREWEKRINALNNYLVEIDGSDIHVIVEEGSGSSPIPLLILHGWPGSVVEFLGVIEQLAHPERFGGNADDAFTVILPSLPGYGFSEAPMGHSSYRDMAKTFRTLMVDKLGFDRFAVQGGDVGSGIASWLCEDFHGDLIAAHLNMVPFNPVVAPGDLSDEERNWQARYDSHRQGQMAYAEIQGTRPLSLAYGLTDSPAGLAAWILEKFYAWSQPSGEEFPPFGMDELICNIMMHWLPGPYAPMWTYGASLAPPEAPSRITEIGVMLFPHDIRVPPPSSWIERSYNLVDRVDAPRGGHFAAFEEPALFVDGVRGFFRRYR